MAVIDPDGTWGTLPAAFEAFSPEPVAADSRLVITEIMSDPSSVSDADGEWFEVYDVESVAVDLEGLVVRPSAHDATDNHLGSSWCEATDPYNADGDTGSPGALNPSCP